MKKYLLSIPAIAITLLSPPAVAEESGTKMLLFVGYPDGSGWLNAKVLRRLGRAYRESNQGVRVEVRPRTGYREARRAVLEGKAAGMMISEDINKIRAYCVLRERKRGFARELKLNRFVPIARRTIRDEEGKLVADIRLGIATDRISGELRSFLDFLASEAARKALADIPDMEPASPAEEPTPVSAMDSIQGHPWPDTEELEQPILTY